MLNNELAATLLAPIGDASPCGDDLEYDADFMALVADAQGKPEQQFGDTVIPAVEPEWREVGEKAENILRRSKDVRAAVLLLRASTRMQGVEGFAAGLRLLNGLLDTFWDGIHPKLDADDDNDPTMRLNALAPLTDATLTTADAIEAELQRSAVRGWYGNLGESIPDLIGLAWPLRIGGEAYAISVAGPRYRMEARIEEIAAMLRSACLAIEPKNESPR